MPRVTVLVPSYNDERFLGAAIESILAQTFTDFELLIVDDASTDGSRAVVERYRDPRIRLLVNPTNLGGGAARNRGLAASAGEYVAALDSDDLSFPDRLERQIAYLDAHPDVAVVGSQAKLIDVNGRGIGEVWRPTTDLGIRWCRIFQNPVIQSSATFRRSVVWEELGGYEERFRYGEDFDLWQRMAKKHAIHNLAEPLVAYRFDPRSLSSTPRHPAREGYTGRKAVQIAANIREMLQWDDVPLRAVESWTNLDDIPAAVDLMERCAARFAALYGEDDDVRRHQAELFVLALRQSRSLPLFVRVWRRHRRTALHALPRFAVKLLFGEWPLRLRRRLQSSR